MSTVQCLAVTTGVKKHALGEVTGELLGLRRDHGRQSCDALSEGICKPLAGAPARLDVLRYAYTKLAGSTPEARGCSFIAVEDWYCIAQYDTA